MASNDPYHALTGKNHPTDASVLEIAEHGRVGGVSTGQPFKFIAPIDPETGDCISCDYSITGVLDSLNDTVELAVQGTGSAIVLVSGTWNGKIVFEGSIDSTWINLSMVQPLGGITQNGIQNSNQNGSYRVLIIAGYTKIRARMSLFTSGSAAIQINASKVVGTNYVWQLNPSNLYATTYSQEVVPTSTYLMNPSLVLTYTDGNLTKVEKTIGATTYTKNLTYTNGNLTGVSVWS